MFGEANFPFKSVIALVALEWSFPSVRPHVSLQIIRSSASVVALVAFERSLSCVHPHHVNFQLTRMNTRIIARCASLWLFTRVRLLALLQVTRCCSFIFTLIAMVLFLISVRLLVSL